MNLKFNKSGVEEESYGASKLLLYGNINSGLKGNFSLNTFYTLIRNETLDEVSYNLMHSKVCKLDKLIKERVLNDLTSYSGPGSDTDFYSNVGQSYALNKNMPLHLLKEACLLCCTPLKGSKDLDIIAKMMLRNANCSSELKAIINEHVRELKYDEKHALLLKENFSRVKLPERFLI